MDEREPAPPQQDQGDAGQVARPVAGVGESPGAGGEPPATELQPTELQTSLSRLSDPDVPRGERRRLLVRIAGAGGRGAGKALRGPRAAGRWALDTLIDVVPHLTVRDLETLRLHYGGKTGEELAEALVRTASRVTAGIGATGGSVAAVEWVAPPSLLSAPVLIAAETVAIVAVEVKLLAELHEVYGVPVTGTAAERASTLLTAWTRRRGVNLLNAGRGFSAVLGTGLRKELQSRLLKRMGRNLTTLGPLLTGAAVAAELNRRSTRSLGDEVRKDLRKSLGRGALPGEILPPRP